MLKSFFFANFITYWSLIKLASQVQEHKNIGDVNSSSTSTRLL